MSSPHKVNTTNTSMSGGEHKRVEHVGDYIIQEKIGQGSFATVYKAQHKVNERARAIMRDKRN